MESSPTHRRLRIMAFDPSLASALETSKVNEIVAQVKWEEDLKEGPIGDYLEVVDYDPASGVFYKQLDLNAPELLAQDGVKPSESNPQFHQQMVYAVAMTTIRHFEKALGRVIFWSNRWEFENGNFHDQFVRRLRIYPHALRDQNAYYSPDKKALLFGYFPVMYKDSQNTPGTLVFTCLSHDIIAHEVTHALLDGVHPRFNEPTNPDVHAFHEAFSDVVALFQHFSYQSVLEYEIQKTRGNLETETLLSQLAQQFGVATGRGSALRDALGHFDIETGEWQPKLPDPYALDEVFQAHARGGILVSAIFRAFLLIYRSRTADLFRIATQGTGVLPDGDIHPDLTRRLAREAAKCAERVLQMCIRAIDYCPPVDITFGDFLRAVITADLDVAPEDEGGYRLVFIQAFREWGIHPRGVTSMSVEALAWPSGNEIMVDMVESREMTTTFKTEMGKAKSSLATLYNKYMAQWDLSGDRFAIWKNLKEVGKEIQIWLTRGDGIPYGHDYARIFGLVVDPEAAPPTVSRSGRSGCPSVEIHSVRPAIRRNLEGEVRTDLVIEITQKRKGYFQREEQAEHDAKGKTYSQIPEEDFIYRAGCTILIDVATQEVRRVIRTAGDIADNEQLDRVRRFLLGETGASGNAFDAGLASSARSPQAINRDEPFALLHQPNE